MKRQAEPRLLIYSQDGLGLGHMRRTSTLAAELLRRWPGASAVTVSDSPLGQQFQLGGGHDYVKLPSIRKDGEEWAGVSMPIPIADLLAIRSEILTSTITTYDPTVILVDHMPQGALGELVPALRRTARSGRKVVLGLRDILDAPEVIRRRWRVQRAYEAIREFYDEVLVYGSREVYDVAAQYAWPADCAELLFYCGYVCAPVTKTPKAPLRSLFKHHPRGPLVLVTAGGGADAGPMFRAVLKSVPAVHAQSGASFLFVTGPFLPAKQRDALREAAHGQPVRVRRTLDDLPGQLAHADLVISMAGYNTTSELLNAGTPALLVPRSGPSAEQRTRSRLFADRQWVRWVDPDQLSRAALTEAILTALQVPLLPTERPDLRGRENAAEHVAELLELDRLPASLASVGA